MLDVTPSAQDDASFLGIVSCHLSSKRNVNLFLLRYDVNVAMWPFSCQLGLPHIWVKAVPMVFHQLSS